MRCRGAVIGEGTLLSQLHGGGNWKLLSIGQGTFVGRIDIQLHAPIAIGSHACINDDVRLISATHDVGDPHWGRVARPIYIGDYAWVATGAVILPGVRIGRGAVVGASAVVAKDVPDYAVVVGNPGIVRESRRSRDLRYSPVDFVAFRSAWLGDVPDKEQPK